MPPESLSTLAVMIPGPRTAKNRSIRIRQRFHISAGSYGGFIPSFLTDHNRPGRGEANRDRSFPRPSMQLLAGSLVLWYIGTYVTRETRSGTHRRRARPNRRAPRKA